MQLYDRRPIRTAWDGEKENGCVSVVNVIRELTDQPDADGAGNTWKVLKNRLEKEGSQLVTNYSRLKMLSRDGKYRMTDAATAEQVLRLMQSIPSKKAEPFQLWPAQRLLRTA